MSQPAGGRTPSELGKIFAGIAANGMKERLPYYRDLVGRVGKTGLLLDGQIIEPIRDYLYIALWTPNVIGSVIEPWDPRGYHRQPFWPMPNALGQFVNANEVIWRPRAYWGRMTVLSIHQGSLGANNMIAYQMIGEGGIEAWENQELILGVGTLRIDERFILGTMGVPSGGGMHRIPRG